MKTVWVINSSRGVVVTTSEWVVNKYRKDNYFSVTKTLLLESLEDEKAYDDQFVTIIRTIEDVKNKLHEIGGNTSAY